MRKSLVLLQPRSGQVTHPATLQSSQAHLVLKTFVSLISATLINAVSSPPLVQAEGLDTLYKEQQENLNSRYEKNKKYCEALFARAKYVALKNETGQSELRYYIENEGNRVNSIRERQPKYDGSACLRGDVQGMVLGKKYTGTIRARDMFYGHELKSLNLNPEKIMMQSESNVVLEGDYIVIYSRDMKTGKIEREPLAVRRNARDPRFYRRDKH